MASDTRENGSSSSARRRGFLKKAGLLGTVGLAGCMGGEDGDSGDGDGGDGSGDGDTQTSTDENDGDTTTTSPGEDELEDKLVIYTPVDLNLDSWFQEKTGVTVEVVTESGPRTTARFFQEQDSGQYSADLLYGPTSTFIPSQEATAEHTKPITDFGVDRQEVMPDGLYQTWSDKMPGDIFERLMPYNTLTNRTFAVSDSLDSPPTSYDTLLEPEYEGNIVAQPFFMDTNAAVLAQVLESDDAVREYLNSLKEQDLLLQVAEIAPILEGRVNTAFLATDTGGVVTQMNQGAPVTVTMPEEGVPLTAPAFVVAENAPHPNAAQRFLELQFSDEAQEFVQGLNGGREPTRPEYQHGNERMQELIDQTDRFPMMLSTDELDKYAQMAKDIWPDITV